MFYELQKTPLYSKVKYSINHLDSFANVGINVMDPHEPFFNDICTSFSGNGDDVTIKDRRIYYYTILLYVIMNVLQN